MEDPRTLHHSSSPRPPSRNPSTYCSDCDLQFESSTSLQVHLAYHKETLNRWASAPASSQMQAPPPKMEPKNEPPSPHASPSPHYSSQSPQHFGPQGYPPFGMGQTLHFLPPQQHQNQFSPNTQQYEQLRIVKPERNPTEPPAAEILDLDSNRVHLYNIQEQNFYRPYLISSHPPPPLPAVSNGWPSQPTEIYHPQFHPPDIYVRNNQAQNSVYNYVPQPQQQDLGNYPPPPQIPIPSEQPPPLSFLQGQQPPQSQQPPRQVVKQESIPSPTIGKIKKQQKKSEGNGSPGPDMRGKGKGGECKRPKAYECTTCNKWFTSSGHLKRHYGTTLHKNSVQQNGAEPEPMVGPGRGKGKKKQQIKKKGDSDSSSGGAMDDSPPPPQLSHLQDPPPRVVGNGDGQLQNNGRQEPPIQSHYGPPPGHPTYLYVPDPQILGGNHHHPQFAHHFEPSIPQYNSPGSIYTSNNNGGSIYPTMEVPLPPFNSVTLSHFGSQQPGQGQQPPTSYAGLNGNGIRSTNGNGEEQGRRFSQDEPPRSPPRTPKQEKEEGSPEIARGGISARSPPSWLSPPGPEDVSSSCSRSSHSSGIDTTASLDNSLSDQGEGGKLIQCPHCSKTFTRTCYLVQHKNSSHSKEEQPYRCPLCGKKFHLEPALEDHVAKHSGEKPYKCHICPKDFNHKTDLRRHICLHTGAKPYVCQDCGKGFIRKDHMNKHTEIHRKARSTPMTTGRLSPPPEMD